MNHAVFSVTIVCPVPAEVARFYQRWFDLELTLEMDWFVAMRRADAPWELCAWKVGHPSVPEGLAGTPDGVCLAFVVDDAADMYSCMAESGANFCSELRDEPWGQRHFYVADPAGTVIDVVQFTQPDAAWLAEQTKA